MSQHVTIDGRLYEQVRAAHSPSLHLTTPGATFTLCGRQALYRFRWQQPPETCARCQHEAAQAAQKSSAE